MSKYNNLPCNKQFAFLLFDQLKCILLLSMHLVQPEMGNDDITKKDYG